MGHLAFLIALCAVLTGVEGQILECTSSNMTVGRWFSGFCAVSSQYFVIAGGATYDTFPSSRVDIYGEANGDGTVWARLTSIDVVTDTWMTKTLGAPRTEILGVAAGKYAIFIGGNEASISSRTEYWDSEDPATAMVAAPDMPAPRRDHAAATIGAKVYVAGGGTGTELDVYVLETSTVPFVWSTLTQPLPGGRRGFAAAAANGRVLFAGGSTSFADGSAPSDQIYIFDGNSWTTRTMSRPARAGHAVASGTSIFLSGGEPNVNEQSDVIDRVSMIDYAVTPGFQHLELARSSHASASAGNHVMFGGGYNQTVEGYIQNAVVMDATTGDWLQSIEPPSQGSERERELSREATLSTLCWPRGAELSPVQLVSKRSAGVGATTSAAHVASTASSTQLATSAHSATTHSASTLGAATSQAASTHSASTLAASTLGSTATTTADSGECGPLAPTTNATCENGMWVIPEWPSTPVIVVTASTFVDANATFESGSQVIVTPTTVASGNPIISIAKTATLSTNSSFLLCMSPDSLPDASGELTIILVSTGEGLVFVSVNGTDRSSPFVIISVDADCLLKAQQSPTLVNCDVSLDVSQSKFAVILSGCKSSSSSRTMMAIVVGVVVGVAVIAAVVIGVLIWRVRNGRSQCGKKAVWSKQHVRELNAVAQEAPDPVHKGASYRAARESCAAVNLNFDV